MAFRVIQRLESQLGGQLRFVFRHLPLTRIHPHALVAAHLAEATALQGRFWPMRELLFHHQQALEDADLWRYADQLGLDRHRLAADLDGRTVWQRVQADTDSALASGARGTRPCSSTDGGTGPATTSRRCAPPCASRPRRPDHGRVHPPRPDKAHRPSRSVEGCEEA
jgi:predicted DsbA family dithiol-disulfide isomerase